MGILSGIFDTVTKALPYIGRGLLGAVSGVVNSFQQQGDSLLSMSSPNCSKHMKTVANLYRGQFLRYHNMKPMGLIGNDPNLLPTTQNVLRQLNERRAKMGLQPWTSLPVPPQFTKGSSMSANTWTLSQFLKNNSGFLKDYGMSRQGLLPIQQGLDKQLGSSLFCNECRITNR